MESRGKQGMQGVIKRTAISRNGVAVTSPWDTRIKIGDMKGGIAGHEDNGIVEEPRVYRSLRRNQSDNVAADRRKRKNWQAAEPAAAGDRRAIQLRKSRSELTDSPKGSHENCLDSGNDEKDSSNADGEKGAVVVEERCEDGKEVEQGRQSFDDKEIDLPVEMPKNVEEEKEINKIQEIRVPPSIEKEPNPVTDGRTIHPDLVKPPPSVEVEEEILECPSIQHNRMQGIVDLVMWRDTSKSAFVFGLGTFFVLSSSYTRDLNFSLISATSYLGLIYLATIFLYKSILQRGGGGLEFDNERGIVGEEEAVWLVRLLLPYINELLLKIRALFSGDPATTMKLAVLLFVMARCGGSITIWTLAKLGFFGVFTIPKVCSSYSVQLARSGKFWLERFRDGWETCTHKKAVAAAAFALIWNLSSTVARMWAVFMLIVAMRLYQQCLVVKEWNGEEEVNHVMMVTEERQEDTKPVAGPRMGPT